MRINVTKYFRKALERHRSVEVEGLGLFSLVHRSAELDHRRGAVQPPGDKVRFEQDQADNAIAFSDFLGEMLDLDDDRARKIVADWVHHIEKQLRSEGSVALSGLGVLSKDEDELSWTAYTGEELVIQAPWPVLYFEPLSKKGEETPAAAGGSGGTRQPWIFWISGAAAVLLLLAAFAYWTLYDSADQSVDLSGLDESRVNKSPKIDSYYVRDTHLAPETTARRNDLAQQRSPDLSRDTTLDPPSADARPDEEEGEKSDQTRKEKDSENTEQSEKVRPDDCVVVVGAFAKEQNVRQMLRLLEDKGYTTYTEAHDTLTRVGVRTPCLNEELLSTLRACRVGVEEDAWILGRRPQ